MPEPGDINRSAAPEEEAGNNAAADAAQTGSSISSPAIDVSVSISAPAILVTGSTSPPPLPSKERSEVGRQTPDPYAGKLLAGRFKVVAPLGRGGMGMVYRAEQVPLGRSVALKVLNPKYAGNNDPEYEQRFFLEASISSKLTHPNTITIFDYGRDGDTFYIAMEYLSGRTLSRALIDDGVFPCERAIHVVSQIAKGVRAAHEHGVIHRDLKPANVMLIDHNDDKDFVKVLDFGLVKVFKQEALDDNGPDLTMTGIFLGSPKYMSPEQIRNQDPDPRCDLYSIGIMLFQMVTGRLPFNDDQPVNVMLKHLNDEPPVPSVFAPGAGIPPSMDALILKCLRKDRKDRYASMDELLAALRAVRAEVGPAGASSSTSAISVASAVLQASPPPAAPAPVAPVAAEAPQPAPPSRPTMVMALASAAVAAVIGVGVAAMLMSPGQPKRAVQPAAATPVAPPPPAPKALPLIVTSEPSDAQVFLDGRLLGVTPMIGEGPPSATALILQLRKDGYDPLDVHADVVNGRWKTHGVLVAAHAEPTRKDRPRGPKKKPRSSKMSDFKDDPY